MIKLNKKIITEVIGWYGITVILFAYILISFEIIFPTSFIYQIMNGTGAVCIMYETYKKRDYQPCFLNLIWLLISIISLIKMVI
jgi:hypothetical protein